MTRSLSFPSIDSFDKVSGFRLTILTWFSLIDSLDKVSDLDSHLSLAETGLCWNSEELAGTLENIRRCIFILIMLRRRALLAGFRDEIELNLPMMRMTIKMITEIIVGTVRCSTALQPTQWSNVLHPSEICSILSNVTKRVKEITFRRVSDLNCRVKTAQANITLIQVGGRWSHHTITKTASSPPNQQQLKTSQSSLSWSIRPRLGNGKGLHWSPGG